MYFEILDVFTDRPLAGNQLAVFYPDQELPVDRMQALAREMNFSESTFVSGGNAQDGFDVRIFTPADELPFAGHPTLGTADSIARRTNTSGTITLNLGVGKVSVNKEEATTGKIARWWLQGPTAEFMEEFPVEPIARMTGLKVSQIDARFPIESLCVGPTFTVVPCVDLQALDQMQLQLESYRQHFGDEHMAQVYGVSREARTDEHDLSVRLLFDAGGVREDPATGSAAVCLGAWILKNKYFGVVDPVSVSVEQGGCISRPSTLYVRAKYENDVPVVHVGGSVVLIAQSKLIT